MKDGGHSPEVDGILFSACIHDSNDIPMATPMFWGQATRIDYWEYCAMSKYVVNQRWRPLTRSRAEIYIISYLLPGNGHHL